MRPRFRGLLVLCAVYIRGWRLSSLTQRVELRVLERAIHVGDSPCELDGLDPVVGLLGRCVRLARAPAVSIGALALPGDGGGREPPRRAVVGGGGGVGILAGPVTAALIGGLVALRPVRVVPNADWNGAVGALGL